MVDINSANTESHSFLQNWNQNPRCSNVKYGNTKDGLTSLKGSDSSLAPQEVKILPMASPDTTTIL